MQWIFLKIRHFGRTERSSLVFERIFRRCREGVEVFGGLCSQIPVESVLSIRNPPLRDDVRADQSAHFLGKSELTEIHLAYRVMRFAPDADPVVQHVFRLIVRQELSDIMEQRGENRRVVGSLMSGTFRAAPSSKAYLPAWRA